MIGTSKFEYNLFLGWMDSIFAVNAQKYTLTEATALFEQEIGKEIPYKLKRAAVIWSVGRDADNKPCAGWWIDDAHDGTEPRHCPVWAFYF